MTGTVTRTSNRYRDGETGTEGEGQRDKERHGDSTGRGKGTLEYEQHNRDRWHSQRQEVRDSDRNSDRDLGTEK